MARGKGVGVTVNVGEKVVRELTDAPFVHEFSVVEIGSATVGTVQGDECLVIGKVRLDVLREAHLFRAACDEDHRHGLREGGLAELLLQGFPIGFFGVIDGEDEHAAFGGHFVAVFAIGIGEAQDGRLAELLLGGFVIEGCEDACAPVEGREVHHGEVDVAIDRHADDRQHGDDGRYGLARPRASELFEGSERQHGQQQKGDVLQETLRMRQMQGLAEAAAVHGRVEDPQQQRKDGKPAQHRIGKDGRCLPQYAGNQADAHRALRDGHRNAQPLGGGNEEGDMEELEVLRHDEHGSHRIPQFKNTRNQEHNTQQARSAAPQTKISSFHFKNGSTAA